MTLVWIVLATGFGGLLSVVIAASLTVGLLSRIVQHLVSLSAGVLLATALLDVLPEAFQSHHGFDRARAGRGGWSVIMGDSIHNFCDGIIIAAAFLTDLRPGAVTSLAIISHEIPQEVGDYIVLLNAGFSRRRALLFNAMSGAGRGGRRHRRLLRGSTVAEPLPVPARHRLEQLHLRGGGRPHSAAAHRLTLKETAAQLMWLGAGLGIVLLAITQLH